MHRLRITGAILFSLMALSAASCTPSGGDQEATELQAVEVVRGDLTVTATGNGKIKAPREVSLTFGSAGKIAGVYIEEGDRISAGDPIARLDTSALELARSKAEASLSDARVAVTKAELDLQTKEHALNDTRESVDALNLALLNARVALRQKEHHLGETRDIYTWPEIEVAKNELEDAEAFLEYLLSTDASDATLTYAQSRVDAAEDKLDAMIKSYDTEEVAIAKMEVEAAEKKVAQAEKDIADLEEDIAIKELQVAAAEEALAQARRSVKLAELSLDDVNRQIEEATLTAPFEGVVASVAVEEGEFTASSSPIVHLVDSSGMELVIEVDELDIPGVEPGQEAAISVDALPGEQFQGTVSLIYPSPREVGGVVLYDVKISLNPPEGSGPRIGMSASADIITSRRSNALMVPSRAIELDEQGKPFVRVIQNGQTAERQVVTGIDDGLMTEVLSGLKEGENVAVETQARKEEQGGGFFFGQ